MRTGRQSGEVERRHSLGYTLFLKISLLRTVFLVFVSASFPETSRFPWCEGAVLLLGLPHSGNLQIFPHGALFLETTVIYMP